MRVKTALLGLLFLAVLAGESSAFAQERSRDRDRDRDRDADAASVREAVVRYQIKNWYLAVNTYCVSVNRRSPRKEFLDRFADSPKIKPASACIEAQRGRGRMRLPSWVTDKDTGQPAVMFDAGNVRWMGEDAAEVRGGYYCSYRCWATGTYQVVRRENVWTVTDFTIQRQFNEDSDGRI
jgi:hypothetical protein